MDVAASERCMTFGDMGDLLRYAVACEGLLWPVH